MNIKQALYDFLTSDDVTLSTLRDEARQRVRELVGAAIFNTRRPVGTPSVAITLARASGFVANGLLAPTGIEQPVIDFTVWSRSIPGAEQTADDLFTALKTLFNQYRGPLNDSITVQAIHLETEPFDRPIAPIDSSDGWRTQTTFSFQVGYAVNAPAEVG